MAVSMRQAASSCLGRNGRVSMTSDIFGYIFGQPARPFSLKDQLERMKGQCFNMSVILVGHRPDFSGSISRANVDRITFAIQRSRELYQQVNFGIRKLYWTYIPQADVGNYTVITDQNEAEDLTEDWSANNDGIDVFFVQSILNAAGWSSSGDGPCDKSDKGMSGAVVELNNGDNITGIILAHEVGHYLGLPHGTSTNNVMGADPDGDGIGTVTSASTNLSNSQGNTMKDHCSVKGTC